MHRHIIIIVIINAYDQMIQMLLNLNQVLTICVQDYCALSHHPPSQILISLLYLNGMSIEKRGFF